MNNKEKNKKSWKKPQIQIVPIKQITQGKNGITDETSGQQGHYS